MVCDIVVVDIKGKVMGLVKCDPRVAGCRKAAFLWEGIWKDGKCVSY